MADENETPNVVHAVPEPNIPVTSSSATLLAGLKARVDSVESGDVVSISPMEIHSSAHIEVTVAEIKAAVAACPDHHTAADRLMGVRGLPDNYKVYVELKDMEGLLTNKTVVRKSTVVGRERIVTKELA